MVHDAGGGGGSTSRWTNWNDKDVPTIWGYIGQLDLDPMWTHSAGWTKTHELASANLYRLKDFRSKLATAWPPEKSEAARVYVAKLDELIANVEAVFDSAVINKASASDMALSLGLAKGKLKPLYEEYQANAARQVTYDNKLATKKQELLERFGHQQNLGYVQAISLWQQRNRNPGVAGRQQEITTEARGIMWGVSTDLSSANSRMVVPPTYTPPTGRARDRDEPGNGGSDGAGLIPPFIPAPITVHEPTPHPHGGGPILSGATPSPTTPPGGIPSPIGGLPAPPPLPGGPGAAPPLPIPPGGVIGGSTRQNSGMTGGVIGGAAGRTPAATGSRMVNPVGGVISGLTAGRSGATPSNAGVRGGVSHGLPLGAGARVDSRSSKQEQRGWDPENPWEVAEGVAPVIEAPAEPGPIDPGPSIGRR
ncbi:hypothetical protein F4553_005009 [Allocatelliglobosispora scoriae]|uniref:PPE family domain-containing protein n=1 Tax=Allocatelliglobosispora scoriae TaxID=643052 RepID=A0A841BY32_9ACTN|nr:hypothetical protein [Allocatelliglobosispora scoriae]MBB5871630.1 hypothetical protein [Allocatelliglobosispora scoriae]